VGEIHPSIGKVQSGPVRPDVHGRLDDVDGPSMTFGFGDLLSADDEWEMGGDEWCDAHRHHSAHDGNARDNARSVASLENRWPFVAVNDFKVMPANN
jgi:hypothetical protein